MAKPNVKSLKSRNPLLEDGGLVRSVEADHEDAHILVAEKLAKDPWYYIVTTP